MHINPQRPVRNALSLIPFFITMELLVIVLVPIILSAALSTLIIGNLSFWLSILIGNVIETCEVTAAVKL